MLGKYENVDRRISEPNLEPVDVLMLTLDADTYLERCLDSVYREIPVNKFIVVDGGSKDRTVEILNKYPRVEVQVRPDIRTTGKGLEFLFSQATTGWVAIIDADMELPPGWYDEMAKHTEDYDYLESKRIMHYEFYREVPGSTDMNRRSAAMGQLGRLDCLKNYHVDDDYMWRHVDRLLKQVVEKNGYRYGKVAATYHYHHTTDKRLYESDAEKRGSRLIFEEPKLEILDKANREKTLDIGRRAVVKYLDPEFIYPRDIEGLLLTLMKLDMKWVKETNVKWYNALKAYKRRRPIKAAISGLVSDVTLGKTLTFVRTIKKACKYYVRHTITQ